jgi:hypothetical protein
MGPIPPTFSPQWDLSWHLVVYNKKQRYVVNTTPPMLTCWSKFANLQITN